MKIEIYAGGLRQKFIDGAAPTAAYLKSVFSLVSDAADIEARLGVDELDTAPQNCGDILESQQP